MVVPESVITGLLALLVSVIGFYSGRKVQEATAKAHLVKADADNSESFLKWTEEFRNAKIETDKKLSETQAEYQRAMLRIISLEDQVSEVISCNNSLEKELERVKSEKTALQSRVQVLEEENIILKNEIARLKQKEGL